MAMALTSSLSQANLIIPESPQSQDEATSAQAPLQATTNADTALFEPPSEVKPPEPANYIQANPTLDLGNSQVSLLECISAYHARHALALFILISALVAFIIFRLNEIRHQHPRLHH